jgi:carbonic anhydrase
MGRRADFEGGFTFTKARRCSMTSVEITYRYDDDQTLPQERPVDAAAARRRLDDGNRAFSDLFATAGRPTERARRVIPVDPRDLGLQPGGAMPHIQRPFAAILGCADARVPTELIFNEGPNDLFVVRVAGNTLGDDVLGSFKYAMQHLRESLKLIVVLGHSSCGAVTAAVDVFLDPAGYLALVSEHAIRTLVDRLHVVVHACARRLERELGPGIAGNPAYREALIETSVVTNAALAAHTLQQEIAASVSGVQAMYGVYVLSDRTVWAPRCGGDEVTGLATPPIDAQGFAELSSAVIRSQRITRMLER